MSARIPVSNRASGNGCSQGTSNAGVSGTPGSSLGAPSPDGNGRRARPSSAERHTLAAIRYSQVRTDARVRSYRSRAFQPAASSPAPGPRPRGTSPASGSSTPPAHPGTARTPRAHHDVPAGSDGPATGCDARLTSLRPRWWRRGSCRAHAVPCSSVKVAATAYFLPSRWPPGDEDELTISHERNPKAAPACRWALGVGWGPSLCLTASRRQPG